MKSKFSKNSGFNIPLIYNFSRDHVVILLVTTSCPNQSEVAFLAKGLFLTTFLQFWSQAIIDIHKKMSHKNLSCEVLGQIETKEFLFSLSKFVRRTVLRFTEQHEICYDWYDKQFKRSNLLFPQDAISVHVSPNDLSHSTRRKTNEIFCRVTTYQSKN